MLYVDPYNYYINIINLKPKAVTKLTTQILAPIEYAEL